jgi:predicted phosphodiesterase
MILFFGDTHSDLRHVLPTVLKEKPAAIILLGDIQSKLPLDQELARVMNETDVWWIPGNHDTDSQTNHDNLFNSKLAHKNLHGRIEVIEGQRVAGLGGVFRGTIWHTDVNSAYNHYSYSDFEMNVNREVANRKIQQGTANVYLRIHKSTIFPDVYNALYAEPADILVTHDAPDCHHHGSLALTDLAQSMKVKKTFHGHHHDRQDYSSKFDELKFHPFGVGLRGVSDIDGKVIRQGELDVQRMRR